MDPFQKILLCIRLDSVDTMNKKLVFVEKRRVGLEVIYIEQLLEATELIARGVPKKLEYNSESIVELYVVIVEKKVVYVR